MRFEAGQRDAREVEGVDPSVFQKGVPARMTCGERSVKSDVVRHDLGGSDKLDKRGQRLLRQRSIRHVLIMDVREVGDIFRNRLTRIHERDEPFSDLAALHARRSDLRQLVMVEGEARGLGVQDDDIGVQLTIIGFRGPRRERCVTGDDAIGSAIADELQQGRGYLFGLVFHTTRLSSIIGSYKRIRYYSIGKPFSEACTPIIAVLAIWFRR